MEIEIENEKKKIIQKEKGKLKKEKKIEKTDAWKVLEDCQNWWKKIYGLATEDMRTRRVCAGSLLCDPCAELDWWYAVGRYLEIYATNRTGRIDRQIGFSQQAHYRLYLGALGEQVRLTYTVSLASRSLEADKINAPPPNVPLAKYFLLQAGNRPR